MYNWSKDSNCKGCNKCGPSPIKFRKSQIRKSKKIYGPQIRKLSHLRKVRKSKVKIVPKFVDLRMDLPKFICAVFYLGKQVDFPPIFSPFLYR
jgi:hypothetical protein